MLPVRFEICACLLETGWRLCAAIGLGSSVSGSTRNGGFALFGRMARRGRLSFVTTIHDYISTPGEILLEEFLEPLGISQYRLAKAIGKPASAITDIVHGRRSITAEMAWLLGEALGTTAQFWLNLQATYDLKTLDKSKLPSVVALTA